MDLYSNGHYKKYKVSLRKEMNFIWWLCSKIVLSQLGSTCYNTERLLWIIESIQFNHTKGSHQNENNTCKFALIMCLEKRTKANKTTFSKAKINDIVTILTYSSEQTEIFFLDIAASLLSCSTCILRLWYSFSRCERAVCPYIFTPWKWQSLSP